MLYMFTEKYRNGHDWLHCPCEKANFVYGEGDQNIQFTPDQIVSFLTLS